MRFVVSFLFSVAHRLASIIFNAHAELASNLFARHPDTARPHQIRRG